MTVRQHAQDGDGLIEPFHRLHGVPEDAIGHAEQVKCLGHTLMVCKSREDGERLLVRQYSVGHAPRVDLPVAEAVETMRLEFRVAQFARSRVAR